MKHNMYRNPDLPKMAFTSAEDPRHYSQWIKTLSPEELAAHKEKVAKKRSMKQAMKEELLGQQELWLQALVKAGQSVLERAQAQGDPQAFTAIWDRVIGRPDTVMDITVAQDDTQDDIMKKLQAASMQNTADREDTVSLPSPQQSTKDKE